MPESSTDRPGAQAHSRSAVNAAKAFIVIAIAAVDGSFALEEIDAIKPTLALAGLSGPEADEAIHHALERYRRSLASHALEGALLLSAAEVKAALAEPERRAFMSHLVGPALADHRLQPSEHAFLGMLAAAWDI